MLELGHEPEDLTDLRDISLYQTGGYKRCLLTILETGQEDWYTRSRTDVSLWDLTPKGERIARKTR